MRTLRLTTPAKATLQEIINYTIQAFGVEQARNYHQQLINKGNLLCNSQFPIGRNCSVLLNKEFHSFELFYIREGRHYLIYTETPELIIIHSFVHVSRELPSLIKIIGKHI